MSRTDARQAPTSPEVRLRWAGALGGVLAAAAVLGVWWFFVTTTTGQHVDEIAFEGSRIGRGRLSEYARGVLNVVSVPFLVLVIAASTVVAAMRRRWLLAVAVAAMVGAANVTTQVLKEVLTRPELGISEAAMNSLPSGHTTVAASVAGAVLLVSPPQWRWLVAPLGAAYAGATGLATMIGGWHRASDVAAAILVVAAWTLLTQAVLGGGGSDGDDHRPETTRLTRLTSGLLAVLGAGAGLVALASMVVTTQVDGSGRPERLLAYGGASLGVLAVACLATLAVLLTHPRGTPG